jgi:hypothetical protein
MSALTWGGGMILVNCEGKDDYAIMKQIQQIKLIDPAMAVVLLKPQPNLSGINRTEKLYVVSHGATGDFFDGNGFGKKIRLLRYLTDDQNGVPQNFSGDIIILSCYGGKKPYGDDSIAEYIAKGLPGRAAAGTVVTGAIGYSFGTPEFRKSGRSSVLCDSAFYSLGNANGVVDAWLKLMPTHTEGILHAKLQINVETNKTIRTLIHAKLQGTGETPEQAAEKLLTEFIDEAKGIEATLSDIIRKKIPGDTAAARADYLVNVNNAGEDAVKKWNLAIERQYELYSDYYLWVLYPNGFTVATVL